MTCIQYQKKIIVFILILILVTSYIIPLTNADKVNNKDVTTNDVEYYAVFLGLAKYHSYWYDCGYSDIDAVTLYEYFENEPNWKEENMKLLINEEVTKSNIMKSIQWLAEVSDENDIVFFYFSGHGLKHKDFSHSCISSYYMKKVSDVENISSDIELEVEFSKVKSKNMVLMFDCCWSARQTSLMKPNRVHISAGGKYLSCVVDWDENLENGFLTYYVCKGLMGPADAEGNNDGIISAEELFHYARLKVIIHSFVFHMKMFKDIREFGRLMYAFPWSQISFMSDKYEGEIPLFYL